MYFSEVVIPVVDLRADPTAEPLMVRGHDRRRHTQLLAGQCVHVLGSSNGWCDVEVPEQMIGHAQGIPRPYRGFVPEEALRHQNHCSCRSSHMSPWSADTGNCLCQKARSYLTQPYLWGGLSCHNPLCQQPQTGPDCSGLVWLAYQEIGLLIPRNAADQCAIGRRAAFSELRLGDLVFTAPSGGNVNHVLIYAGPTVIEATVRDGAVVREILPEKRFGFPFSSCMDGDNINDTQFFFRGYLS